MQYEKPETVGIIVGLIAVVVSIALVSLGTVPNLGNWWFAFGLVVLALMVWISYKISDNRLATALLGSVFVLVLANYGVNNYLLPSSKDGGRLVLTFWLSMIVDVVILVLSVIWIILFIKRWVRKWEK